MRWGLFVLLAAAHGSISCAELGLGIQSRVVVHINKGTDRTPTQSGREIELRHLETEGFSGQKAGYFAIRDANDWLKIWDDPRPDRPRPPPAPQIDWDKTILISAAATTPNATGIEIEKVIATENQALQVYVLEHVPGENCPDKLPKDPPIDIVAASKPADVVTFWVDRDVGVSCGARPNVRVQCRIMSSGAAGIASDEITAAPGQVVNCDGLKSDPGSARAIMDRNWFFTLAPNGSTSKMKLSTNNESVTFPIDAYGTYTVRLEVTDNEGRSNDGVATIEVPPPADETVVQLGWGKITAQDDPTTFPRIELRVTESGSRQTCSTAQETSRPAWCRMDALAALTHVRVKPAEKKAYKFSVKYIDTRYQGGPMVCLRVFAKGQKPAETCDDNKRNENTTWDVGFLDFESGAFLEKEPQPKKEEATKDK
jgi:hypothetical protein